MAKKTFKIGEYCRGGVITVETKGKRIDVIAKDWDFSAGSNKGSSQVNAKEWNRLTVQGDQTDARWDVNLFLNNLTTSYWADKILKWVEGPAKFSFKNEMDW